MQKIEYQHAPADYLCLFCMVVRGDEGEPNQIRQTDVIYQDEIVTAFIALKKWPTNPGHVLVISNRHYENIFDLPDEVAAQIQVVAKKVALSMKLAYKCDGILLRQHNEPAGGQRLFHYHLHVIPRFVGDDLFSSQKEIFPPEERVQYTQRLRAHLPA